MRFALLTEEPLASPWIYSGGEIFPERPDSVVSLYDEDGEHLFNFSGEEPL